MVMNSIPDVTEYFNIFDDYLDFEIKPWDKHGYDQGEMIPERKVAIRYLMLAMNIHKKDPALLPTNFLTFMSDYQKPEYQEPEKQSKPTKKYGDLRKEVDESEDGKTKVIVKNKAKGQKPTHLSQKSMEGFNLSVRAGASTSDVIEKTDIIPKSPTRYVQTTTRSVFWDVPGEDSINPETWDVTPYTSQEDLAKIQKNSNSKKAGATSR